jgi:hypothetical protein
MAAASTVFLLLGPGRPVPDDLFGGVGGAAFIVMSLAFVTTGAIVASHVPGNRIGWLFCLIGLLTSANILAYEYANYGLHATAEPLMGAHVAAVCVRAFKGRGREGVRPAHRALRGHRRTRRSSDA